MRRDWVQSLSQTAQPALYFLIEDEQQHADHCQRCPGFRYSSKPGRHQLLKKSTASRIMSSSASRLWRRTY